MMKEDDIKYILEQYQDIQIQQLEPEQMEGYNHVFSPKFEKKIKRLFWCEKYFGNHIYIGYAIRKAAIIAIIILSVVAAAEVSAKVFGFRPWKVFTMYSEQNKMEQHIYKESADTGEKVPYATGVAPSYVPTDYKILEQKEENDGYQYMYLTGREKAEFQYLRLRIKNGLTIAYDAEYTSKENLIIKGYRGCLYYKGEECWMIWDDKQYTYFIGSDYVKEAKKEMLKMAESIYE